MQKKYFQLVARCLSLALLAGCATSHKTSPSTSAPAQKSESRLAQNLAAWDKTKQGVTISFAEFNAHVCDLFASYDLDQDGYLSMSEFAKLPTWIGPVKPQASGQISIVDFVHQADEKFRSHAKQNAGWLTKEEFASLEGSRQ
jgi:hypothetical protein